VFKVRYSYTERRASALVILSIAISVIKLLIGAKDDFAFRY